jgi:hypothetical protein
MVRSAFGVGVLLAVGLVTGCVERKYVITSDPPGAIVYRDGQFLGATPVDDHFVYYGNYHYTLVKDGYETLQVDQPIPTPWYQWIGIDFLAENVWPFMVHDTHHFHYQMQPLQVPRTDEVIGRGQELRQRGLQLGPIPGSDPPPPEFQGGIFRRLRRQAPAAPPPQQQIQPPPPPAPPGP